MSEFDRFSHSTGKKTHHLEWCTKYRYKMFRKLKYRMICKTAIQIVAERHGIIVRKLAVQPDHVHIIANIPPTMSQSEAMRILKGGSSYEIFRLIPNFRLRYPRGSLWSRGPIRNMLKAFQVCVISPIQPIYPLISTHTRKLFPVPLSFLTVKP